MALTDATPISLGGQFAQIAPDGSGRLSVGPLVPGDVIDELRLYATHGIANPEQAVFISVRQSATRPASQAQFENEPDILLARTVIFSRFDQVDTTGIPYYSMQIPLLGYVDRNRRYVTVQIEVASDGAGLNGTAFFKVFRRRPDPE